MRESKVERALVDGVKKEGGLCLKWISPGCTGVPDRIVILPNNKIHFVELKSPGKKPSDRQKLIHEILKSKGCKVWVIENLKRVEEFLEEVLGGGYEDSKSF